MRLIERGVGRGYRVTNHKKKRNVIQFHQSQKNHIFTSHQNNEFLTTQSPFTKNAFVITPFIYKCFHFHVPLACLTPFYNFSIFKFTHHHSFRLSMFYQKSFQPVMKGTVTSQGVCSECDHSSKYYSVHNTVRA